MKGQISGDEMEKETNHYVESLNHDPNLLKMITIEINKFLINREYINFFIQIYIQWRKYGVSTSSSRTLIIPLLPRFDKLALSPFQLYTETKKMTQYFVCRNFQKTILIRSSDGKEKVFGVLHMLRIHTVLRKLSNTNVYDLHL